MLHNAPSLEKGRLGWIALNRNPYIKRCVDTSSQWEKRFEFFFTERHKMKTKTLKQSIETLRSKAKPKPKTLALKLKNQSFNAHHLSTISYGYLTLKVTNSVHSPSGPDLSG